MLLNSCKFLFRFLPITALGCPPMARTSIGLAARQFGLQDAMETRKCTLATAAADAARDHPDAPPAACFKMLLGDLMRTTVLAPPGLEPLDESFE